MGGFDLEQAQFVEVGAHGLYQAAALAEDLAHLGVDGEIYVALTVALFGVGEGVIHVAFGVALDNRERTKGFGENGQRLNVDGYFAGARLEGEAPDADEVAQVEQLFDDGIEHGRRAVGLKEIVAAQVQLDAPRGVLQVHKKGFAGFAGGHDAACQTDILVVQPVLGAVVKRFFGVVGNDVGAERRHVECGCRIRLYAEFAHLAQGFAAL